MINIVELEEKINNGISLKDISIHFSVSLSTIKRIMVKNGLKSKFNEIKKESVICLNCGNKFDSLISEKRKFCNSSCSSKFNNKRRRKKSYKCLYCEEKLIRKNKFCKIECDKNWKFENVTLKKYQKGLISDSKTLIKIFKKFNNYYCSICGNSGVWMDKSLSLQLDHIDGDFTNNMPMNLRILCPNCHTQTETWGSKNKKINIGRRIRKKKK